MELPRSVRWYRERSIIIAIACNEVGQTATKTGNILRGDGENTSGLERRRRGGGGARARESQADSRIAYAYVYSRSRARASVRVYANAPHGATRRPTEWSATKKKKSGKDEPSREPEGKDVRAKRRSEKPRRRNRGVRTSDSNYLELQANDPTIHRHAVPPTTVTFVPRRL